VLFIRQGEEEYVHGFGGKTRRKETIMKTYTRWKYNIKMDLREIRCGGMNWINLTQNRNQWRALVNTIMNVGVL
jgi:hypothetical protein